MMALLVTTTLIAIGIGAFMFVGLALIEFTGEGCQHLQNSPLTRWMWRHCQHEETGRMRLVPIWRPIGRRWYKVKWRE